MAASSFELKPRRKFTPMLNYISVLNIAWNNRVKALCFRNLAALHGGVGSVSRFDSCGLM